MAKDGEARSIEAVSMQPMHEEARRRRVLMRCGALMVIGAALAVGLCLQRDLGSRHRFLYGLGLYVVSLAAGVTGLALLLVIAFGRRWRRQVVYCLPLCHAPLAMAVFAHGGLLWYERIGPVVALALGCLLGLPAAVVSSIPLKKKSWLLAVGLEAAVLVILIGAATSWAALVVLHEVRNGHAVLMQFAVNGGITVFVTAASMRLILAFAHRAGAGPVATGLLVGAAGASAAGLTAGVCLPATRLPWGWAMAGANAIAVSLILWLAYECRYKLPVRGG